MTEAPTAPAGELFTRGGLNMPDTRGPSMVAAHAEKMQKAKEDHAMEKLRLLLPHLSAATHAVALQECNWEEDRALVLLRAFQSEAADELHRLHKERKRSYVKAAEKNKTRQVEDSSGGEEERSGSSGSDGDSSSSEEDGERSRERKRKKEKESKRSRSTKDDRGKKRKKEKESRRDRKRRKKEKKERRKEKKEGGKARARDEEYGKYGVIRETDYYAKRPEFTLWALEAKKVDVETLPRFEEKELFKTYMEDYNTATMPHRKYYDLEAYEKEQAARDARRGGEPRGERSVFDDEQERKKEVLAERQREHAHRLRAAYEELKTGDKAQAMREQEIMRAKMALAYRTGDLKEAQRLQERLKPDEKP